MPLCSTCGRDNPPDGRFCPGCGAPAAGAAPYEVRKTVTVVFCDLVGSTGLAERHDSESFRRVLSRYYEAMRGAIERHGGSVEKFIGDAVMAVFGVPTMNEDDALRAVRAANDMRAALPALNEELERRWGARLETRIGVNTGEAVAIQPARGEASVVGDTVNVAARLEQAAPPGEILLAARTHALVRDAIEAERIEPLALKGKAARVHAFRLIEVIKAGTGPRRLASAMIGRSEELERLEEAFERCILVKSPQLVIVTGQAGVGKSRVTDEFIDDVHERARVIRGRCLPYGDGITLWPVVEAVRDAAGIGERDSQKEAWMKIHEVTSTDPLATQITDHIAAAIGLSQAPPDPISGANAVSDVSPGRDEIFWAIRRFLERLATARPLVVVLDDMHRAEATLVELIEHVAAQSRGFPVLIICMARPELLDAYPALMGPAGSTTPLALEPLEDQESRLLMRSLLGGAELDQATTGRILDQAGGNPLFVEELLRILVDDGLLEQRDGEWHAVAALSDLPVPGTIEAVLGARLDRLQEEERAIIERAAVVGQEFWPAAVAELAPEPITAAVDGHLRALVRKELLRRGGRGLAGQDAYRFAHILIRDVAYRRLLKESRSELHERCATWLERATGEQVGEYAEILGYHLEQAYSYRRELGPVDERWRSVGERAARHLAPAGRRALARGDMLVASNLLERASALPCDAIEERLETLVDLAAALSEAGWLRKARAVITDVVAAAAATGDRRLEQHALVARAWFQTFKDDPALSTNEMETVAERAIPVFDEFGDEVGLAKAWHLAGRARFTACQCAAAAEALEPALLHARRAGDRGREAEILLEVLIAHYFGPTPSAEAIRRCEEILTQAEGRQRIMASALNALAGLNAMRGQFAQARDLYSRGHAVGTAFSAKPTMAATALYSGDVEMLAGDYGAAEHHLRWGYQILVEIGETTVLSTLAAQLGEAVYAQGRIEEAEAFSMDSEAAAATGDVFAQVAWRAVRAKTAARRGEQERAVQLARQAARMAEGGDALNLRADATMALAEVLAAAERRAEAVTAVKAAMRLYEQKGNRVSSERARAALLQLSVAYPLGQPRGG